MKGNFKVCSIAWVVWMSDYASLLVVGRLIGNSSARLGLERLLSAHAGFLIDGLGQEPQS